MYYFLEQQLKIRIFPVTKNVANAKLVLRL